MPVTLLQPVTSSKIYQFFWPAFLLHVLAKSCLAACLLEVWRWLLFPFSFPCPVCFCQLVFACCLVFCPGAAFSRSRTKEMSAVLFRICNPVLLYSPLRWKSNIYGSLGSCSAKSCVLTPFLAPFPLPPLAPGVFVPDFLSSCFGEKHFGTSELICSLVVVSIGLRLLLLKAGGRSH